MRQIDRAYFTAELRICLSKWELEQYSWRKRTKTEKEQEYRGMKMGTGWKK